MTNSDLPYRAKSNEAIDEFTNEYGERWACVFNSSTGTCILLGDEVGWELDEGLPLIKGRPADLILSPAELDWLDSCWQKFRANGN